jgi:hypothetical protein
MMLQIQNVLHVKLNSRHIPKLMDKPQLFVVIIRLILDSGIKTNQDNHNAQIKAKHHKILFLSFIQEMLIVF